MAKPRDSDDEDERDRRITNVFLLVMFVLVVGGGIWLVNAMIDYRNVDNCMSQGRRNCGPIETPSR
jgi:hypothetical protein